VGVCVQATCTPEFVYKLPKLVLLASMCSGLVLVSGHPVPHWCCTARRRLYRVFKAQCGQNNITRARASYSNDRPLLARSTQHTCFVCGRLVVVGVLVVEYE
jgi:hypothetical protein